MRAAVLHSHGSVPVAEEFRAPALHGSGQALVDVAVGGLNPVDILIAGGAMPGLEPQLPSVVGREGIGRLAGRRCYFDSPVAPFGSFGEQALVDEASLIDVPDGVSDELAVSFGNAGLAAWLALDWRAGMAAGDAVLVLGSSGVVGQIAVQAARLLGAGSVIAAARDEPSLDRTGEGLGADATVTIGEPLDELTQRLTAAARDGFDMCRHAAAGELNVPVERIALEAIGEAWERQQHSPRRKLVIQP